MYDDFNKQFFDLQERKNEGEVVHQQLVERRDGLQNEVNRIEAEKNKKQLELKELNRLINVARNDMHIFDEPAVEPGKAVPRVERGMRNKNERKNITSLEVSRNIVPPFPSEPTS